MTRTHHRRARLRVAHLFPDVLNVYGDGGNLRALVVRAERRQIPVDVTAVRVGDRMLPAADLFVIGGGEDREQGIVAGELQHLAPQLLRNLSDGAALLAVCAGYQLLGRSYLMRDGTPLAGAGVLPIKTIASRERLVGPVVAELDGWASSSRRTLVGFENHSGRTVLDPGAAPLATVEIGYGNNGADRSEGYLGRPGTDGVAGLRIGTYLHGPLLPRNPHVADLLIAAAVGRGGEVRELEALDDGEEWQAHDRYLERVRAAHRERARMPDRLRRIIDPARGLIGF